MISSQEWQHCFQSDCSLNDDDDDDDDATLMIMRE